MTDIIYKFILSILGIIIITLFISIIFKKLTIVIEPNPFTDFFTNTIGEGVTKSFDAFGKFISYIREDIRLIPIDIGQQVRVFHENTLENTFALGSSFFDDMETIGRYLGDCVISFSGSLICAVTKIENFATCFKYYFVYIFAKVLYLPISILVSILRLKHIETLVFEYVDKFDCFIYDLFGFYLFHFSDEIQRKCFICEMKFPSPLDESDFNLSNFSFPNNYSNMSDPFDNLIDPLDAFKGVF